MWKESWKCQFEVNKSVNKTGYLREQGRLKAEEICGRDDPLKVRHDHDVIGGRGHKFYTN